MIEWSTPCRDAVGRLREVSVTSVGGDVQLAMPPGGVAVFEVGQAAQVHNLVGLAALDAQGGAS
jgi:hypothetical protein